MEALLLQQHGESNTEPSALYSLANYSSMHAWLTTDLTFSALCCFLIMHPFLDVLKCSKQTLCLKPCLLDPTILLAPLSPPSPPISYLLILSHLPSPLSPPPPFFFSSFHCFLHLPSPPFSSLLLLFLFLFPRTLPSGLTLSRNQPQVCHPSASTSKVVGLKTCSTMLQFM